MATADLFVEVYVLVDDALRRGVVAIPARPGPVPAWSDAPVLTIALVRHLLARPAESAFLAEVVRDWRHFVPILPTQSEPNRRVRWRWGACEALRVHLVVRVPADGWQQVDTSARPVKHLSRVRGPDGWDGPGGLRASVGRDAAHRAWLYGFRLALRADLGSRLVRAWGLLPAAVDERALADGLLEDTRPTGLLLDRGLESQPWAARHAARGTRVVTTPSRAERRRLTAAQRRPVALRRNRIATTTGEITETLGLARHRAKTLWGLLTRTASTLTASASGAVNAS